MMSKGSETAELNMPSQALRPLRYMVKAILPESQTYGLRVSYYPLQLMGNRDATVYNRLKYKGSFWIQPVVRCIPQYPSRIKSRTRHLSIAYLTCYIIQGIPKWERQTATNKQQKAMNLKDSENPIWYRSSSSTQRLPVMGLARGSGTGWFDIKVLKESRTWQKNHLSNWMS
jgi:hypothetical protein